MAKYTITIADIDLNISTEESPEMVERLVSTLDRRIRELLTRMPRLSKSEAAILCAVDYCAQNIKTADKTHELEHDFVKLSKEKELLREENAKLQANTEDLRRENQVMHSIITRSVNSAFPAISKPIEGEQLTIKTEEKVEDKPAEDKPAPATKVMFKDETSLETPPEAPAQAAEETPVEPAPQKPASDIDDIPTRKIRRRAGAGQNKVGDMFDMLTFKDV